MSLSPEQQAEFAKLYADTIKEALEGMDRVAAEAKATQQEAFEEIRLTQQARKHIEDAAEATAKEILESRRKRMEEEIRTTVTHALVKKLVDAGRSTDEISNWLDVPKEIVKEIRTKMTSPDSHLMDAVVRITQSGRGGVVQFIHGDKHMNLHWEFGGGKALALIFVPDEKVWEAQTGYPLSERINILDWIARQVIYQKASGCIYIILDDVIEILHVQ